MEPVRTGSCRRFRTNSLKQITTPKPSRHPRCPARFHGVGADRFPCVPSISFDTSIASSLGSRRPVSGTAWPRPCNRAFLLVLFAADLLHPAHDLPVRSEERRVGKGCHV